MNNNSVLLLLSLIMFSCQKEDDNQLFCDPPSVASCVPTQFFFPLPQDSCVDFPPPGLPEYQYSISNPLISDGKINPENLEEILFTETTIGPLGVEDLNLWILDTCAGNMLLLVDHRIYGQPSWGKNNLVLFASYLDGFIYKIKSNTDSLTRLTEHIAFHQYDWCLNGEAFFYRGQHNKISYLVSTDGIVLDSFDINYPLDLEFAEYLVRKKKIKLIKINKKSFYLKNK